MQKTLPGPSSRTDSARGSGVQLPGFFFFFLPFGFCNSLPVIHGAHVLLCCERQNSLAFRRIRVRECYSYELCGVGQVA